MKMFEVGSMLEQKNEGQGFAGVVVAVFVTILIGAVLLGPVQTSINTAKGVGLSASTNTTVDNVPLLFAVLLLVAVLAAMVAIIS